MPTLFVLLSLLPLPQDAKSEPQSDPVAIAYEQFRQSSADTQAAVVQEITRRIDACDDQSVRALLELRDRAVRELKIEPRPAPAFYDPATYAPGQARRRFVERTSPTAQQLAEQFYRVGSVPLFAGRISYDFGANVGLDSGADPSSEDQLWNYLYGYPPKTDVLVAWLEMKLDHDDELDAYARHFAHAYCDLNGNSYEEISLYDAFASEQNIDMPDADCIAFARNLLNDDSYVSPIPPDQHQQQLYRKLTEGHLRYFRHRTFVEYTANLLVNPEIPISWAHEQLRDRILYGFHLDQRSVTKIRNRMIQCKDRLGWVDALDKLTLKDPSWSLHAREQADRENATRWVIARIAQDVLKQHGMMAN